MNGPACHPLAATDLAAASRLHGAAFAPFGERGWTRPELEELYVSPGVGGVVLAGAAGMIGFALYRVAADEAELLTIAVDAGQRRHGGGRALLEATIDRVGNAGARSLFLEVAADNPAATALYRQKDFAVVGRRAGYYERGTNTKADALVMRLEIRPAE
jgi:ribosomal-protein-alanine N-acetyltransferase